MSEDADLREERSREIGPVTVDPLYLPVAQDQHCYRLALSIDIGIILDSETAE